MEYVKDVIVCRNPFSWSRGLMFRPKRNLVMEFPSSRKVALHMWFVFYPIDVLVLDEKKKVVEIKRGLKPFSFWKSSVEGKYVVELVYQFKGKVGDRVSF